MGSGGKAPSHAGSSRGGAGPNLSETAGVAQAA